MAGAGGSCPMVGRLEPVVHSWITWVTWGIVITIKRKANEPKWAVLGDSCATPLLCLCLCS